MIKDFQNIEINKIVILTLALSGFVLGILFGYLTDEDIVHEMSFNSNYESIIDPTITINKTK